MTRCPLCSVTISEWYEKDHVEWHQAHNLHAAQCDKLIMENAQRRTDMNIVIPACSCGLDKLKTT